MGQKMTKIAVFLSRPLSSPIFLGYVEREIKDADVVSCSPELGTRIVRGPIATLNSGQNFVVVDRMVVWKKNRAWSTCKMPVVVISDNAEYPGELDSSDEISW
jgi:hypothetical protein